MPNPKVGTVTMDVAQGDRGVQGRQGRVPHRPHRDRPPGDRQEGLHRAPAAGELRGDHRRADPRQAVRRQGPLPAHDHARVDHGPRREGRPVPYPRHPRGDRPGADRQRPPLALVGLEAGRHRVEAGDQLADRAEAASAWARPGRDNRPASTARVASTSSSSVAAADRRARPTAIRIATTTARSAMNPASPPQCDRTNAGRRHERPGDDQEEQREDAAEPTAARAATTTGRHPATAAHPSASRRPIASRRAGVRRPSAGISRSRDRRRSGSRRRRRSARSAAGAGRARACGGGS